SAVSPTGQHPSLPSFPTRRSSDLFMKKITSPAWAAYCLLFIGISCKGIHPATECGRTAYGSKAMVVTAHPEATKVGLDILARGANSVDAMVAVNFALAVVYPSAGNIGGGGFMVMR